MSTRRQIVLAVSLIAVAAVVVAVGLRRGVEPAAQAGMEGHDMASMSAPSGEILAEVR